jgi:hypothetical protein
MTLAQKLFISIAYSDSNYDAQSGGGGQRRFVVVSGI